MMSRRLTFLDRLAGVALGLLLLAAGLLALDWRFGWVFDLPASVDTSSADDVLTSTWWPWAFAVAAVLLGLLGLRWLLAHATRPGDSSVRLAASNETGRLEADLGSLAGVAASRLETLGPVSDVRGHSRTLRGHTVVELKGRVDTDTDVEALISATSRCADEVADSFDGTPVTCRVLLRAPRTGRRATRTDRVRVG